MSRGDALQRLTPDQKRILLVLCKAMDAEMEGLRSSPNVRLRVGVRCVDGSEIRETTTGSALARKGLAQRFPDGSYCATVEGYWFGDGLRIEDRIGKIPRRRIPS